VQLRLADPAYTDRLTSYLTSLGQHPVVAGPDLVELDTEPEEIEVYLRVWKVLYPDAEVHFDG
jgi:hypothetical protein